MYETPTQKLQTWHQPKPTKMVSASVESIFMHEPPVQVEHEIEFDIAAAPFFTSPLMEVSQNVLEIKLMETIHLPASVCSGKISNHLPQMGQDGILFCHENYCKNIDELTALEERSVEQNCSEWRFERKLRLTASAGTYLFLRAPAQNLCAFSLCK
ncbi:hypothetical protein TNCT_691151 [Trichonephila clavata]|uniref:Uncharacterized protein n=1 Tax=Trichonephila clavata TaxID=2740835 RepID=A0A8X6H5T1_TRICU|nr:hypothetical protein TNCT_691151 [Trichonephila clavata]